MAGDQSQTQPQSTAFTLFRGWLEPGKHVWSPFVIKLEARFRFANLKYATDCGSPRSAPKGKIPYIQCRGEAARRLVDNGGASWISNGGSEEDSVAGMGDSALIIKALVNSGLLPDINAWLSPEERASDLALRALLEDKLYFYHTRERWMDNYYTMRDHVLWSIPYPLRVLVGILVHRKHTAMLDGQGVGKFSNEEVKEFKHEIWQTIDGLLQASKKKALDKGVRDGPFWALGGDGPTEADTTLFGFIVSVLLCTAGPDSQRLVRGLPTVVEYAERIHDKFFPDYEKWPAS